MSLLALSDSFEYLCYWSSKIIPNGNTNVDQ